jgi:uroporphyrinogen decarboxylase
MNTRERFLAAMAFEPVDRGLLWELGYWAETIRRWYREGLPGTNEIPEDVGDTSTIIGPFGHWWPDRAAAQWWEEREGAEALHRRPVGGRIALDVSKHFGFDQRIIRVPVQSWIWPPFEARVVEDRGDTILELTSNGTLMEQSKGKKGLPRTLSGPVQNREDWERVKAERFHPDFEARVSADWDKFVQSASERDYPLIIGMIPCGMHASLLTLFGEVQYFYALYDHRELMEEMLDYLTGFWIELWDKALAQVGVDAAFLFEDMCYRSGSIVSPAMVREMMLPQYKRLTSFLRSHGVEHVIVDTDGDCRPLIPVFLEGGITGLFPWEVTNGQDIVEVRERYPRLQIIGGMDKKAIAQGWAAIDQELEAKVPFMFGSGGFVPTVDHVVPSDVSWENFRYYRERLAEM